MSEAVAEQRSVVMQYRVASRDELTRRKVDPLALVYYTDHWNLIAFDHLRSALRTFRLDHIESMTVTSERFEPPADFDLGEYLREKGAPVHSELIDCRSMRAPTATRGAASRRSSNQRMSRRTARRWKSPSASRTGLPCAVVTPFWIRCPRPRARVTSSQACRRSASNSGPGTITAILSGA
jgi:predicted DNA-binding transcriptional regulator YafY